MPQQAHDASRNPFRNEVKISPVLSDRRRQGIWRVLSAGLAVLFNACQDVRAPVRNTV
jgi:hypothetical protein